MATWHAAWYRSRVELRRRVGTIASVAMLVALVVGGVLGVAIGDRRNATAFDRYVAGGGGPDLLVTPGQADDRSPGVQTAAVRAVPGVTRASEIAGFAAMPAPDVAGEPRRDWAFEMDGPTDARLLRDQMRPIMVAGRPAGPRRADEAIVNTELANRFGIDVGDRFAVQIFLAPDDRTGTRVPLHITGIARFPDEILRAENRRESVVFTSLAFVQAHRESVAYHLIAVDLDNPASDTVAVSRAVTATSPRAPPGFATMIQRRSDVRLATCAVNSTMIMFDLIFGLLGLIVLAQVLRRVSTSRAGDDAVLAAIGAPVRTRLVVALAVPTVGIALGLAAGSVLATSIASRFPVGLARRAELHPGLDVNWAWTLVGMGIAAVTLGLLAAGVAWQTLTVPSRRVRLHRPARFATRLRRAGVPLTFVEGARRALSWSPGRDSTRRGIVGVVIGVTGIVLAVVFLANVQALVHAPDRFGWTWDELIETNVAPGSGAARDAIAAATASPAVEAVAAFSPMPLRVDGVRVPAVVADQGTPPVPVTIVKGEVPTGPSQVALGGLTMRRLGIDVGDRVRLSVPSVAKSVSVTVVGEVVLPAIGVEPAADMTGPGTGAYVPLAAARPLTTVAQIGLAVRFVADAGPAERAAVLEPFRSALAHGDALRVSGDQRPDDIVGLAEIGPLPGLLAASLALLLVVEFGLTLVSATRSRRRDLAVLAAMGFVRRQVVGVVLAEAVIASIVATAVGTLLGVALGRFAWLVMTGDLAIADTTVTPFATVALVAVAVVLGTALVALGPAWSAARSPVASTLASE
jgi:ABC-type lipoprotein release transport system permease subunit